MPPDQLFESGFHPEDIHPAGDGNHVGHIVVDTAALHLLQNKQALLGRREGVDIQFFRRLNLRNIVGHSVPDHSSQFSHSGVLKHCRKGDSGSKFPIHPRQHHRGFQRMAS